MRWVHMVLIIISISRHETVAAYLFGIIGPSSPCVEAECQRGTSPLQYWWNQEMNLDGTSEADEASVVIDEDSDSD